MGQLFSAEFPRSPHGTLTDMFSNSSQDTVSTAAAVPDPDLQPFTVEEFDSPRFEADDPEMVKYLEEHGYVVVKAVASAAEVAEATDLLWSHISAKCDMHRDRPESWSQENFSKLGSGSNGILYSSGINQSPFLWRLRLLPKVKAAFAAIWKTDDLLTSFDGGNIFRPWHSSTIPDARLMHTRCGWFHVDQGEKLRGLQCVQGLVTLTDASADTGGFCVIPGSHKAHDQLMQVAGKGSGQRNFVQVPVDFPALREKQILPRCRAGDMVLWDSRCIHCNTPALALTRPPYTCSVYECLDPDVPMPPSSLPEDQLIRLVGYVCMTPSARATPEVLRTRVKCFERAVGTTHWPHTLTFSYDSETPEQEEERRARNVYDVSAIPAAQRALIVGSAPPEM